MWWPGTELNRRRQPFQGCALPPELPGHFPFAQLSPTKRLAAKLWPCTVRALTGRDAAKQNSRCAGTVRNSRIITTICRSLKMIADDLRAVFIFLRVFSTVSFTTKDARSARHLGSSTRIDLHQTSTGSRDSHSPQIRRGQRLCQVQCCLCGRRVEAPMLR